MAFTGKFVHIYIYIYISFYFEISQNMTQRRDIQNLVIFRLLQIFYGL